MSEMRTEEEQVEAIKQWWKENGKQTVVAAVVVLGGWFGYQGYESQKLEAASSASVVYQELIGLNDSTEEADQGRRTLLLDQLQTQHGDTVYAMFAGLFKAKAAVEANDLDSAKTQLEAVMSDASDAAIKQLATVRLARVLIAQEKADEALSLLAVEPEAAFIAEYEETKGDAFFAKGEQDNARDAYSKAITAAERIGANNPVLKMKLDDLAVAN